MKTLLETLNYQPHSLSEAELEKPETAIADFFGWHELHEVRTNFQEFYLAWEHYNRKTLNGREKKEMTFFIKNLTMLVEAGQVLSYRCKEEAH